MRSGRAVVLNWINGFTGIFPFFFPALLILRLRVRKGPRTQRGKVLRLIQIRFSDFEF
jgi:hypothetical protein